MATREISNSDDVIDSRDVIARIEALTEERDSQDATGYEEWQDSDSAAELGMLCTLAEEAEQYAPDWKYGEVLIRDSYFQTYAQELAEDCGMMPRGLMWPCNCIDWDRAARELRQDYTAIDFAGVTYWIR